MLVECWIGVVVSYYEHQMEPEPFDDRVPVYSNLISLDPVRMVKFKF
jgi:hypothetical protein